MNTVHAIDDYLDHLLNPPEDRAPAAVPVPAPAQAPDPVAAAEGSAGPATPSGEAGQSAGAAPVPQPPALPPVRPAATPLARPVPAPGGSATDDADSAEPQAEQAARWLRLLCGGQTYALELLKIREVVLPGPLLPLRGAVPAVSGVMNLRGQVVPIVDMGLYFGGEPTGHTPATRIVVLEERNEVLGLQVSAVEDIVLIDEAKVESARASRLAPVGDERIRGIARLGGRLMLLLDASRLLATPLH